MASQRRRNIKTHPKPRGDDAQQDDYMPPDRPDRDTGEDNGRTEVVDVFGTDETVTVEAGDDIGVDRNSAGDDARSMSSEGDGDAASGDDTGRGDGVRRGETRDAGREVRGARRDTSGRGDDGGEEPYSTRVRKRIARERALTNRERALREQKERELAAERTTRQELADRVERLERATTEVAGNASVKDLEAKIEALKPQLTAALEAGDTAKILELQDKLGDLKADLRVLKYDLQKQHEAATARANNRSTQTRTQTSTDAVIDDPRVAQLVEDFQRANRHWWNRSANKEAKADAITIDKEIIEEIKAGDLGFEPYSDEHFEEIARRLHETYPDLEVQDLEGQPYNFDEEDDDDMNDRDQGRRNNGGDRQRPGNRSAPPIGRRGQNGRRQPDEVTLARQGKVQLTTEDFQQMRKFGMNPSDPQHKKYFAQERRRTLLGGGPRNTGGNR